MHQTGVNYGEATMQIDMHYYGVYAMARAAGLTREASAQIATASELVDDNAEEEHVEFGDGGRLDLMPTAHHTTDIENRNEEMQRKVWVPFHFIPGNRGRTVAERLVCRKDSAIAREVVEHAVRMANRAFGPQLLGITAHVYADTFSHYGFSGASCPVNRVNTAESGPLADDEAAAEARRSRDKFAAAGDVEHEGGGHWWTDVTEHLVAGIAEVASGALGHAGVATWPDKPFLVWTAVFEHEVPAREMRQHRDNPKTFLEGCRALHRMFCKVGREAPHLRERVPTRFADIEERVQVILATVGDKDVRSEAWTAAAMEGAFTDAQDEIPPYGGHDWLGTLEDWRARQGTDRAVRSQEVVESDTFRFYQAAAIHRTFVLRDLLPTHGLAVN